MQAGPTPPGFTWTPAATAPASELPLGAHQWQSSQGLLLLIQVSCTHRGIQQGHTSVLSAAQLPRDDRTTPVLNCVASKFQLIVLAFVKHEGRTVMRTSAAHIPTSCMCIDDLHVHTILQESPPEGPNSTGAVLHRCG